MAGPGKLRTGSTKRRAAVCLAVALSVSLGMFASTSFVRAQFGLREVPPKNEFFRFKAKYTVKATGEVIQFDLVRPCRAVYAKDWLGESISIGPGKYEPGSYFFNVIWFPKVTADHHAIVVRFPNACDGQTTANGKVPADMLPFTSWFEDADDFAFGWMYATEDAYKSPLATITFEGASIEVANKADFADWQKHAADNFRPSKIVESPFGVTYDDILHKGIPIECWGVRRIPLPPELRKMAKDVWPTGHPRFWAPLVVGHPPNSHSPLYASPEIAELMEAVHGVSQSKHPVDGVPMGNYEWGSDMVNGPFSIPTRKSGTYPYPQQRPPILYPQIEHPLMDPPRDASFFAKEDLYLQIDARPERYGFLACYNSSGYANPKIRALMDSRSHRILWRVDSDLVEGQPVNTPLWSPRTEPFFERDEFSITPTFNAL